MPTSVYDVVGVKVVDGIEHLPYGLGGVLLCELPVFTDSIKELSSSGQFSNNVVFILPLV